MSLQIKKPWEIDRLLRENGFIIFKRPLKSEPTWIWTENGLYNPCPLKCQMFLQSEAVALIMDTRERDQAFEALRK